MNTTHQTVTVISVAYGSVVSLPANFSQAFFTREGADLVLTFDSSLTTFKNFFAQGADGALPRLVLPDGSQVDGSAFLQGLDPNFDIATAMGPASAQGSGGAGEYSDDSGTLIDGVDRFGSLGTIYWSHSGERPEEFTAAALPAFETASVPAPAPTYAARLIVSGSGDAASYFIPLHNAQGATVLDANNFSYAFSGSTGTWFQDVRYDPQTGMLEVRLTQAGLDELRAGNAFSGMAEISFGNVRYPLLLQGAGGESHDGAVVPGEAGVPTLVSEWYQSHDTMVLAATSGHAHRGGVENAVVRLDGTENNTFIVSNNATVENLPYKDYYASGVSHSTINIGRNGTADIKASLHTDQSVRGSAFSVAGISAGDGGRMSLAGGGGDDVVSITASMSGTYFGDNAATTGTSAIQGTWEGHTLVDGGGGNDALHLHASNKLHWVTNGITRESLAGISAKSGSVEVRDFETITIRTESASDVVWSPEVLEQFPGITESPVHRPLEYGIVAEYDLRGDGEHPNGNLVINNDGAMALDINAGIGMAACGGEFRVESGGRLAVGIEADTGISIQGTHNYSYGYGPGLLLPSSGKIIAGEGLALSIAASTAISVSGSSDGGSLDIQSQNDFADNIVLEGNVSVKSDRANYASAMLEIRTEGGDDRFTLAGDIATATTGGDASVDINLGTGKDFFSLTGDINTVPLNYGESAGTVKIQMDADNDTLELHGSHIGENVFIDGGAGLADELHYFFDANQADSLDSFLDALAGNVSGTSVTGFEKVVMHGNVTGAQETAINDAFQAYRATYAQDDPNVILELMIITG